MSHLRSLRLLASLLLGIGGAAQAVTPGLDAPVPVAPYFGGVFPSTAPGDPSGWAVVNAFPNLTFTDPMMLTEVPGQNQFLVVGKTGLIWRIPKDSSATMGQRVQVLDWTAPTQTSEDQGFYGLAFHPRFGQAGQIGENSVYVCYNRKAIAGTSDPDRSYWTLSRFTWLPASGTIDPASEYVLMSQYDPHRFHNGGAMFFSSEGYLHITVGDGGASADTFDNAQRINMGFFSGVLRIDVDYYPGKPGSHAIRRQPQDDPDWSYLGNSMARPAGWPASYSQGYGIPDDNPWLDPGGSLLEEFYAVGLRSPHSAHYDPPTGDIWIGDVGQSTWEELSKVVKGSNCQWAYKEGPQASSFRSDPNTLVDVETSPIHSYDHTVGNSIIGGMRYRGSRWASFLSGKVIFGDHGRGRIWNVEIPSGGGAPVVTEMFSSFRTGPKKGLANFSTDGEGEIYMMDLAGQGNTGGRIMKLAEPAVSAEPPQFLSQTGVFSDLATLTPAPGVIPYSVANPLWSDEAHKYRWIIAPNDGTFNSAAEDIVFSPEGNWVFPAGTVFVKHFEVPVDANNPTAIKRLETRFLVCTTGGGKYGFTYKWNAAGTDAELMDTGLNEAYDYNSGSGTEQKTWSYPSRGDCMVCHNDVAGQALGVRTAHLNSKGYYPTTGRLANQLETFNSLGMFNVTLTAAELEDFIEARALDDETAPLEHRVRSYLDSNCSHCHQPGAQGDGFDARLATPLDVQNLINAIPTRYEELGAGGRYIKPGDTSLSAVYVRAAAAGNGDAMPPLAKNLAHAEGVAALGDYIQGLVPAEFDSPPAPEARYVRLRTLSAHNNRKYAAVCEFVILDGEGVPIPVTELSIAAYSSQSGATNAATKAIDGSMTSTANFWQTPNDGVTDHPHFITVDVGHLREIGGYTYVPRQGTTSSNGNGRVKDYEVHYSADGVTWTLLDSSAQSGQWDSTPNPRTHAPGFNKRAARCQIAGPVAPVTGPFEVTTVFDMDTTEFTAADIQVTGGTVTKFRGSGYYYVARISPSPGSSSVQVSVPEDAVSPEGKGSLASSSLTVTVIPDEEPPDPPGNLAANPELQGVELSWDAAGDNVAVTSYRIFRGTGEVPLASVTGTTYADSGLNPNTQYLYRVVAVDDAGNVSDEAELTVSTLPDTVPPSVPESLGAVPNVTSVALSWTASTDIVGVAEYRVYRGTGEVPLATVTGTTYADSGLNPNTQYLYRVVAVDDAGNVSEEVELTVSTLPDTVPPSVPESLESVPDVTSVVLSWTASTDIVGVAEYRVYRGTGEVPLATVTGTTYADSGLNPSTQYLYRVVAVDNAGNVSEEAELTVSTLPDTVPPSVPESLGAVPDVTSVVLSWTASTDIVGVAEYRVYRGTGEVPLATVTGTTYADSGLNPNTQYLYRVVAVDDAGNVSEEAELTVSTLPDTVPPSVPESLGAVPYVTSVALSWTASTDTVGVAEYRVYRGSGDIPIATVTGTTYMDSGLNPETEYFYRVVAVDDALNVSGEAQVMTSTLEDDDPPTAPGNLAGSPDLNSVLLTWTASTDEGGTGVDRYRISRNGTVVGTVTGLSFNDTGLESGITYHYAVVAIDEEDNVSEEALLAVETSGDNVDPLPPGDLAAEAGYTSISLTWTAGSDNVAVTGYEIRRSGETLPVATVTGLSFTVEGLASDTSYTYEVRTKDAANRSSEAVSVTVTTLGYEEWLAEHALSGQEEADSDHGGLGNRAEFELGMDPHDGSDDALFRLACTPHGGTATIAFPELLPLGSYHLHASDSLEDIANLANRVTTVTRPQIVAMTLAERLTYTVEVPVVGERSFFVLVFEPFSEP